MMQGIKEILGPLLGLIGLGIGAYFTFKNTEIQKNRKRKDLYRLLKAEIMNLRRHSSIVIDEIQDYDMDDASYLKTAKYKDGSMLLFDSKEAYLLNENLCQDVMQLSLYSRNNDIHIQSLVEELAKNSQKNKVYYHTKIAYIKHRMSTTVSLCDKVLSNLEDFIKNPKGYAKPVIDW